MQILHTDTSTSPFWAQEALGSVIWAVRIANSFHAARMSFFNAPEGRAEQILEAEEGCRLDL